MIISPLVALMQDQVKKLSSLGLQAAYVGGNQHSSVLRDIEQGKVTFVFMSPESTLASEKWRNVLASDVYQENLIGIVVDEVHCVTEWGTSNNNEKESAFRRWYSRLNELKLLVCDVPFLALTATATKKTRDKIFELLEFKSPKEVLESQNKPNVRYSVQKLDNSQPIIDNFHGIILELRL